MRITQPLHPPHPKAGIWSGTTRLKAIPVQYTVSPLGFVISANGLSARRAVPVEDFEANLNPTSIKREV